MESSEDYKEHMLDAVTDHTVECTLTSFRNCRLMLPVRSSLPATYYNICAMPPGRLPDTPHGRFRQLIFNIKFSMNFWWYRFIKKMLP